MSYNLSELSQRLFIKALERGVRSTRTYSYSGRYSSVSVTSEFYVLENEWMRVDVECQKTSIAYRYQRSDQRPVHRGFIDISQDGRRIFTATRNLENIEVTQDYKVNGEWRVHLAMNGDEILSFCKE